MEKQFSICDECIDIVAEFKAKVGAWPKAVPTPFSLPLFTSTADFTMCSVCQRYDKTSHTAWFNVQKYHEEPCDCEIGRPQHNDGGNYHYTTWQPIKDGT